MGPFITQTVLESILAKFPVPGTLIGAGRFGAGLINDTFLCEFSEGGATRKYVLQRINAAVFRRPGEVMENVELVTAHMTARLRSRGIEDPSATTPALVRTRNGRSFLRDGAGDFWRMFHFIESGVVYDTVTDARHAYEVGRGLGLFQSLVSDLPPDRLHDTLPGFHHTPKYLSELDEAFAHEVKGRAKEVAAEMAFAGKRRRIASILTDLMASGEIPLRVVHNDPKVNNVMIHAETREALCMLDLDTVKPGIVHFDFGDCVRSAANPAGEDAADLNLVGVDLSLFEAIAGGYLREAEGFLTQKEIELLPASVKVITFELGMRFLADYLRGDTYFRINYPGHNLHRARVQLRLLESIEAAEDGMAAIVARLASCR